MSRPSKEEFHFRRQELIGAPGAEEDEEFLNNCFVDLGDLAILVDCAKAPRIVVGRTGAGKSALLLKLAEREEHVVSIAPESLSLQYLSNSNIIQYLEGLGVKLDVFYKLLWKHVFAVELIRMRFPIRTEEEKRNFIQRAVERLFGDKRKEAALKYLERWGESFWKDTDSRVREVTNTFESEVRVSLGAKAHLIDAGVSGANKLTEAERTEIVQRAQTVVDSIQIRELSNIIKLLAEEYFSDEQPKYYLVIDKLDEDWVENAIRFRLIKALIEAVRDYQSLRSVKIIVALRRDLLDSVIRATRSGGFQEEKYEALLLRVQWSPDDLLRVLDQRVAYLVRRQYTKQPVGWRDLMPDKVHGERIDQYVLSRTMYRPRDVIMFFNACIEASIGTPSITVTKLMLAEAEYSKRRVAALQDEWHGEHPDLGVALQVLHRKAKAFSISEIAEVEIIKYAERMLAEAPKQHGSLYDDVKAYYDGSLPFASLLLNLASVLYKVGAVGLKTAAEERVRWSFRNDGVIAPGDLDGGTRLHVCPVFFRAFGTPDVFGTRT